MRVPGRVRLRLCAAWLSALVGICGFGALPAHAGDLARETPLQFAEQLRVADSLAQACAADKKACDSSKTPTNAFVDGAPGGAFQADWLWLADTLHNSKEAKDDARRTAMAAVSAHLRELAAEAGQDTTLPPDAFRHGRHTADAILARPEFRTAQGPTWWERQMAKIQGWIFQLFNGLDRLGSSLPWLAPVVEWGCFGLAVTGLLWFARRSLARQAVRLSFAEGAALATVRGRDAEQWRRLAGEHAGREEWRDALHCLYWAAIATMEGRRAWRPNPNRTPREYLRLLRPGSEAHTSLRELTRSLEHFWYGRGEADGEDFTAARTAFSVLQEARPERTGVDGNAVGVMSSAAPAGGGA